MEDKESNHLPRSFKRARLDLYVTGGQGSAWDTRQDNCSHAFFDVPGYVRREYPKKSVRIGSEYQADLPALDDTQQTDSPNEAPTETRWELLWEPQWSHGSSSKTNRKAEANKNDQVTHLRRHSNDTFQKYDSCTITWDASRRNAFAQAMVRHDKNYRHVCQDLQVPMGTCLAYYYQSFKKSFEYRILKDMRTQARMNRQSLVTPAPGMCIVCDDGGELLICDGCEREYHPACLRPPLLQVPKGYWECDVCVDRRFLACMRQIKASSTLYQTVPSPDDATTTTLATSQKNERIVIPPVKKALENFGVVLRQILYPNERGKTPTAMSAPSLLTESPAERDRDPGDASK